MRAFSIIAPGKTEIVELEKPVPKAGEVLLEVRHVGFCGGDLNAFRGTFPLQEYPAVLGHEVGAVVEETGADVPGRIAPGTRVTLSPYSSCGVCTSCRNGRPNACRDNKTMGVRRPGAMTEYIVVPWRELHTSAVLDTRELALVEPLTVGFHAVARGKVDHDDTVAVFGAGMVGIGAISGAASRGAVVIAVDIDDRKLEIARKAGAVYTVNSLSQDLHESLSALTWGDGPDVVIEAVGSPKTYIAVVEEVAFTGRVVFIGYAKSPVEFETRLFVQKELDVYGSRNCLGDFPAVIAMLEKRTFPIDELITREVGLEEAVDALAEWDADPASVAKILVRIDHGRG